MTQSSSEKWIIGWADGESSSSSHRGLQPADLLCVEKEKRSLSREFLSMGLPWHWVVVSEKLQVKKCSLKKISG